MQKKALYNENYKYHLTKEKGTISFVEDGPFTTYPNTAVLDNMQKKALYNKN
jgi:hypothetical protein